MRIATVVLLVLHALIHLLGVAKEWRLLQLPEMTGRTLFTLPEWANKLVGGGWLTGCLLLLTAAALLCAQLKHWWLLALCGVAVSQLLVIYSWHDAKVGTIANVLLLLPIVAAIAHGKFERDNHLLIHKLFTNRAAENSGLVQSADLERVPPLVRRWLVASRVVGKPRVHSVRLRQSGLLRASNDAPFMPVHATQYFRTDQPGFVWCADVTMLRFLPVSGRDSYVGGHGHMLISLAGLVPVVDAANARIDEGTLQRYLAELVWFPAAALDSRIQWRVADERAEATLVDHGVKATVTFEFDAEGKFQRLTAMRFKESGEDARRERWLVTADAWSVLADTLVPSAGDVRWQLQTGELTVYRWSIDELQYNRSDPY